MTVEQWMWQKPWRVTVVMCLVAGVLVSIVIRLADFQNERVAQALDSHGVHTTGTVTRVDPGNHSSLYYSFEVKAHRFTGGGSRNFPGLGGATKPGQRVGIIYDRRNPALSCSCNPKKIAFSALQVWIISAISGVFVGSLLTGMAGKRRRIDGLSELRADGTAGVTPTHQIGFVAGLLASCVLLISFWHAIPLYLDCSILALGVATAFVGLLATAMDIGIANDQLSVRTIVSMRLSPVRFVRSVNLLPGGRVFVVVLARALPVLVSASPRSRMTIQSLSQANQDVVVRGLGSSRPGSPSL